MNNTDKLLRVFIEASGFDVESIEDIKRYYRHDDVTASGEPKENAMPESIIKTVDYKVTKKRSGGIKCTKCGTHLAHSKPLDSCLCKTPLNLVRFD